MAQGPFGALITLQFCLTAAPAAQPFNSMLAQSVALTVGLSAAKILEFCQVWIRQSVATALSITFMSMLGIVHPPAGASAIVFAGGGFSWKNAVAMLLGNTVAIVVSTLVNNFHDKRHYPTFWGFHYLVDSIASTSSIVCTGLGEAVMSIFAKRKLDDTEDSDEETPLTTRKPDFARLKAQRQNQEMSSSSPISILKKSPSLVMNNRLSPPNLHSQSMVAFGSSNSIAPTEPSSTTSSVSSSLSMMQRRSFLGTTLLGPSLTRTSSSRSVLPRTVEIAGLGAQQQQALEGQRESTPPSSATEGIPRGGLFDSPFAYGSFAASSFTAAAAPTSTTTGIATDAVSVSTSEGFRDDESFFSFM